MAANIKANGYYDDHAKYPLGKLIIDIDGRVTDTLAAGAMKKYELDLTPTSDEDSGIATADLIVYAVKGIATGVNGGSLTDVLTIASFDVMHYAWQGVWKNRAIVFVYNPTAKSQTVNLHVEAIAYSRA